jgi:hypothetical protein
MSARKNSRIIFQGVHHSTAFSLSTKIIRSDAKPHYEVFGNMNCDIESVQQVASRFNVHRKNINSRNSTNLPSSCTSSAPQTPKGRS